MKKFLMQKIDLLEEHFQWLKREWINLLKSGYLKFGTETPCQKEHNDLHITGT